LKWTVLPSVADFLPAAARCFGFSRSLFFLVSLFLRFFFAKSINLVSFCSPTDYTDFTEMLRNHFQRAAIITSALTKNPMNPKNP